MGALLEICLRGGSLSSVPISCCPDSNSTPHSSARPFFHPPRSSHHLPRYRPLTSVLPTPCVSDTARTRRGFHLIDFPSPTTSTRRHRTPPHLVSLFHHSPSHFPLGTAVSLLAHSSLRLLFNFGGQSASIRYFITQTTFARDSFIRALGAVPEL